MKIFYIIALVLSVIFGVVIFYYIDSVHSARMDYIFSDYLDYGGGYNYSYNEAPRITTEGALITILFMIFYALLYSFTLAKIKTTTAKVMSIIGVSITGIFILWDLAVLASPGGISYDEAGFGFLFYAIIMLAFCIVNLVQASKGSNVMESEIVLDDVE